MKKLILIFAAVTLLVGCITTPTGTQLSAAGQVALQESAGIAVRRYLRDRPNVQGRMANIRAIVAKVASVTDATTIGDLKVIVVAEVNARVTEPLDRADALALVNVLYAVLLEQVGQDKLDIKGLTTVNEVLSYILAALPPG